ncbi:MAG TPA: class E sortase [Baekduia sp.]|nr:class E sortase [Baekduia sp.]
MEKLNELLAVAEQCSELVTRVHHSATEMAGSGALGEIEHRVASVKAELQAKRADALAAQLQAERAATQTAIAERDQLVAQLARSPERVAADDAGLEPAPDRRRRRLLTWVAIVALIIGILAVVDAFMTVVFEEPISHVFQAKAQSDANTKLMAVEASFAAMPTRLGETREHRIQRLARLLQRRVGPQGQLGRLSIPSIGLKTIFFQGAVGSGGEESLRKGTAHYTNTRMPGIDGTVGIAGHRTTFGAPFRRINELKPGARIIVKMPYGKFTYLVEGQKIVSPQTVSVLTSSNKARSAKPGAPLTTQKIVLTACHPLHSAAQRIVVSGRLVRSEPIA